MSNSVTPMKTSILAQARAEVAEEQNNKAKTKLKELLRQQAAAEAVVRGIELQIKDVEQQIADGTL